LTNRPVSGATIEQTGINRSADVRLTRALSRARWVLAWERLWPTVATVATVVGLFLAVSWLGTWLWLPPLGRAIGVGLFFLLAAAAFATFITFRIPTTAEGLRRLDRNAGLPHRPATAMADDIATDKADSLSVALWRAHIERALRSVKTLKAGVPVPRMAGRDPFALRGLVAVALVATFFAAGGDRMRRIAAAFDWHGVVAPANYRIDAWITPPNYTGKPPVILVGMRPGEAVPTTTPALLVPAGSMLVIRSTGQVRLDVATTGGLEEPKADPKADPKANDKQPQPKTANGADERRFVINEAGTATLRSVVARDLVWQFNVIPDRPPTIALTKDPEGQTRGALQLTYKVEDDYGVVGAQATFKMKKPAGANGGEARPLYDAPEVPLVLPQTRAKSGTAQTIKDFADHPWAGADATMVLTARDRKTKARSDERTSNA